ncbi:MAG: lytic transglycosylase domain-containing protein [Alphaproteobacteria bacterium]
MKNMYVLLLTLFCLPSLAVAAAWPADVPVVLSESDVKVYKEMFRHQRMLEREKVAELSGLLENRSLIGHLAAVRLQHPRVVAKGDELAKWLELYNDHPQAKQLYDLAQRRGQRALRLPVYPTRTLSRYNDPDADDSGYREGKAHALKGKVKATLDARLKLNKVADAGALLANPAARSILGDKDFTHYSIETAQEFLKQGQFAKAYQLLARPSTLKTPKRREALWLAGFSAYRAGLKNEAGTAFRALVYASKPGGEYYARAAFWAGRTYGELKNKKLADVFTAMAADDVTNFYGQLAAERLGTLDKITWKDPQLDKGLQTILLQHPNLQRMVALAQVGEVGLAQEEMRAAYKSIRNKTDAADRLDETILAMALKLDLPHVALQMATNLLGHGKVFLKGLYPVPTTWKPYDGVKIDPALMLALMRQESLFNPATVSKAGARGLMQIMPNTADYIRRKQGKFDLPNELLDRPDVSTSLAQWYVQHLMEQKDQNLLHVVAAYNAGPGNVKKWLADKDMKPNDPLVFVESIPFAETRKYVRNVFTNLWLYQDRFKKQAPTRVAMARGRDLSAADVAVIDAKLLGHGG